MKKVLTIVVENCPQNHKCPAVAICPMQALSQIDFHAPIIDTHRCIACGKCSDFCPKHALVLQG
ncbi:MAG: 4Fe-4S binding protein [Erysipelotrichaceae bacterium]|nr:4Fe-4S binding protein [Erysipelotrichaceae bacterium]